MFLDVNWSDGATVFVTVLVLLLISGITVFLFFRTKKERRNYKDEVKLLMEGVLSKSEINMAVNAYINKIPKDMSFGIMLVDYDHFSEIAEAYGESEAKKILEKTIGYVDSVLPNKVQMGRYDKDQFVILVRGDFTRSEVIKLAGRIKEAASIPIKLFNGNEANPHASVAVAFYPFHGRNIKQLLNSLSIALYIAKKQGGDMVVQYSDEMNRTESENVQYYNEIKTAIENKEFMLYYQPIIDISEKKIYGCEALLRWQHPEHGLLAPGKFIHILEQSGDINWVGIWGIENLMKEYFNLRKSYPEHDFQLSMNLSPKQLTNENLIMDFQKLIKKYRIQTKFITIEIVEFAIFERHEIVRSNITKLQELGFKIAVDGFAIDPNTLEKLKDFPLDIIKLDKDFLVDDENSYLKEKYAEMLIEFSNKNNKTVICEGIENYQMLAKAEKFGINIAQGYYLSKPISEEDLVKYIRNEKNLESILDGTVEEEKIAEEEVVTTESFEGTEDSETLKDDAESLETPNEAEDTESAEAPNEAEEQEPSGEKQDETEASKEDTESLKTPNEAEDTETLKEDAESLKTPNEAEEQEPSGEKQDETETLKEDIESTQTTNSEAEESVKPLEEAEDVELGKAFDESDITEKAENLKEESEAKEVVEKGEEDLPKETAEEDVPNVEKKAAAPKSTAKKATTAKKPASSKSTAKKTTTAKKSAAPKSTAKKTTSAKKPAASKSTAKKTTDAKKSVASKSTTAKKTTSAKKPASSKSTAKKTTTAKKPAAKTSESTVTPNDSKAE